MPAHVHAAHRLLIDAPVERCFMYFTPAGEELWVDGWRSTYLHPQDGHTEAGMVFTTGEGDEFTVWTLVEVDRENHRSRYVRCTPASCTALVEVACRAADERCTEVCISYTLTALNARGVETLAAYEGQRFAAMIDGWAQQRRELLLAASVR